MKVTRIQWSVEKAAAEFNINPRTLSKRLKQAGIDPGQDGKYSTLQIATAVYGDLERERIRKTAAEADILEVERAQARREVMSTDTVDHVWANVALAIRRTILTSALSQAEQDAILQELQTVTAEAYRTEDEYVNGAPAEEEASRE